MPDKARNDGTERILVAHVKQVMPEDAAYDILVVASDATLDRHDEIIDPKGWVLDNFKRNPVILAAHMHRLTTGSSPVVGHAPLVELRGDELVLGIKFAGTPLGAEYRVLYRDGHMRAVSVGFAPIEGAWEERDAPDGKKARVWIHTRQELWETSCVAVGANPNALARMRAAAAKLGIDPLGLDEKTLDALAEKIVEGLAAQAADLAVEVAEGPDLAAVITEALNAELGAIRELVAEARNEILACIPDPLGQEQAGATGPGARGPAERAEDAEEGTDVGGRESAQRLLGAMNP